jgi:hypothetical protein
MTRPAGRTKSCKAGDARKRLDDARRFLAAADREVEPGNGDVVASLAILSAIAAADVLCCLALGERSNDGNHAAAIKLLSSIDPKLATSLRRALDRKQQAGYETGDLSDTDAASCVEQARKLHGAAQAALLRAGA